MQFLYAKGKTNLEHKIKRLFIVATVSSFLSPVARRYGGALFELARAENCADEVEKQLTRFMQIVEANSDLQHLITSPVFAAREQHNAINALVEKAGLVKKTGTVAKGASHLVANFLKVVAAHRRLSHLGGMVEVLRQLNRQMRGEVIADVTSAHALTKEQQQQLKKQLDSASGKNVGLRLNVDPALLGGLVVRLGSRQLDTSLKTKLSSLKMHLKEVG